MNPEKFSKGGPAFPAHPSAMGDHDGMTLRDYFATAALQALTAATINEVAKLFPNDASLATSMAMGAYELADAMLEERNK